jgi:hypothetical protein
MVRVDLKLSGLVSLWWRLEVVPQSVDMKVLFMSAKKQREEDKVSSIGNKEFWGDSRMIKLS